MEFNLAIVNILWRRSIFDVKQPGHSYVECSPLRYSRRSEMSFVVSPNCLRMYPLGFILQKSYVSDVSSVEAQEGTVVAYSYACRYIEFSFYKAVMYQVLLNNTCVSILSNHNFQCSKFFFGLIYSCQLNVYVQTAYLLVSCTLHSLAEHQQCTNC